MKQTVSSFGTETLRCLGCMPTFDKIMQYELQIHMSLI